MRERKFRGICNDKTANYYGKFIHGYLGYEDHINPDEIVGDEDIENWHEFDELTFVEVTPETIGQFTGLLDKNGKEIYEGDICELKQGDFVWRFIITFERLEYIGVFKDCIYRNFDGKEETEGEPEYVMGDFNIERGEEITDFVYVNGKDYEIIGNVHENADLLK